MNMLTIIILFATGVVVGIMNAVAGGGGLVGYPILLAVGLPPLTANATSYVAVLPGQASSAYGYRKFLRRVPKLYALLLIPCAAGATLGAHFLRSTSSSDFTQLVPFLVLFSVGLFALQPIIHRHLIRHIRSRRKNFIGFTLLTIAIFIMTIYGGYFGIGLGFSILALIGFTNIREVHMMNGMKNIASIVIMMTAIITIFSANIIHWQYGLIVAAGGLLGGFLGSHLAQRVPSHIIRIVAIVIGLTTAGYLLVVYH